LSEQRRQESPPARSDAILALANAKGRTQDRDARASQTGCSAIERARTMNLFDTKFLFASLLWGSIGVGYWIYGKKQQAMIPMIAGAVMVGISCLISSWLLMSLICIALMIAVYQLLKRGY
jgi:hypothetical protein